MYIFTILLVAISALLITKLNTLVIGIAVLFFSLLIFLKKFRFDKKKSIIYFSIFGLFLLCGCINISSLQEANNFAGIVIRRKENYVVVFDGLEQFYVYSKNNEINLFDIIKINGSFGDITFTSIESEFDFKNYLNKLGIERQIYLNSYTTLLKNPIDFSLFNNYIINQINSKKSKTIVNTLFLDNVDFDDFFKNSILKNAIFFLLSFSGIYFNYFIYKANSFFKNHFNNKIATILTVLLVAPLFVLNVQSFIVKRLLVFYLVKFISNKFGIKDPLTIKSFSYLVLLINKYNLYQYGFIMPLIISTVMSFSRMLFKRKKWYIKKFAPMLLIFITILPFNIQFNNSFNVVTILFSFIIMPIIRFLIVMMLPLVIHIKIPFLENILDFFYDLIVKLDISMFSVNVPPFDEITLIIYYLILFILLYFLEIKFQKFYKPVALLITSFILLYSLPIKNTFTSKVSFINVGQGDSTLIRVKNKTILIDTGGNLHKDIATNSLIPYFKKNRIYKIDAVFITHYDVDHYYALESLKVNFNVLKVYDYNNFNEYNNEIISIYNLNNNFSNVVDENSRSLVLDVRVDDKKFLFMGDAPIEIEKNILDNYENLDCDILKVGHHGSDTSSSLEFLKEVSPEEAVISCGINNSYGHPHEEVIKNLEKLNIKIRRTDLEGTIEYTI